MIAANAEPPTPDADGRRLTREAPPPQDIDWPELLNLADRLGVTVWRPGPDAVLVPVTQPPTQSRRQLKEVSP